MKQPEFRFWTTASEVYLSDRLGLTYDSSMQDWPYEIADASRLTEYLNLFSAEAGNSDVRFTLADVIIQSFEDLDHDLNADERWRAFLDDLSKDFEGHAFQIWYWSSFERDMKDAWRVAPYMRALFSASTGKRLEQ